MAKNYGRGSVYAEDDGYRGAIRLDGKRYRVRADTKREAWDKLDAIRERHRKGLPVGDQSVTVGDFLERWLKDYAPARPRAKSANTQDQYKWAVRTHLKPALGAYRLRDLTADHVETMLRAKSAKLSRSTVNRIRAVLVLALTYAERRDLVSRNVAKLAEMPVVAKEAKPGRSMSVEQAQAVVKAAQGDRLEALWLCGLWLGLRPGELTGLCWDDIDLDAGRLTVNRSLKKERGKLYLGEPKTSKSRRTLDLPAPLMASLRKHHKAQSAERLIAGAEWDDSDPLVFRTEFGKPIRPEYLRALFGRLTVRADIGDDWHPHEMRHSAASLLSAGGMRLEEVADVLGHEGTRMVAQVYRHAVSESVSAHVEIMERMLDAG